MVAIYVQVNTTEKVAVVEENQQVKELIIDRPATTSLVGNIYLAKVKKIEKGLQAAFLDFGQEKLGFLQQKELVSKLTDSVITEGQRLIVQVQKDAYGSKGSRLTTNITIPGAALVYLPFGNHISISRKLDETSRHHLKQVIEPMLTEQEGVIIRTASKSLSSSELEEELIRLRKMWSEMKSISKTSTPPTCIFEDRLVPNQILRKYAPSEIENLYIDSATEASKIRETYPSISQKVQWKKQLHDYLPVNINQLMEAVVHPVVKTNNGIELYIEQTEALTVIDIDTGGFTGKMNKNQTIVRANKIAALEIAHQLRLRNISGMIVIDFIRMENDSNKKEIILTLKQALAKDPVRTEVFGFTKLGLLEMTRKRDTNTIGSVLVDDRHKNHFPFSTETQAYRLERELLEYNTSQYEAVYVEMHPKLFQKFTEVINMEQLKNTLQLKVYLNKIKGQASYQIKLAGSELLVNEHLSNKRDSIDKLF